jgi:peptidoglycan hydrolase-like protein with peptidoglycan-binding domain
MRRLILAALFLPLAAYAQSGADPNVELVKRVQEQLHVHGYDVGRIDGMLDIRTQGAVAEFQRASGLPAGGTIDRDTLKALGVDWAEIEVQQASGGQADGQGASAGETQEQPK